MTEMAPFHELANVLPLLEGEEFQKLVADVRENGVLLPIVEFEGKILDGRNRLLAAREAGVEIRFIEYSPSRTPSRSEHGDAFEERTACRLLTFARSTAPGGEAVGSLPSIHAAANHVASNPRA